MTDWLTLIKEFGVFLAAVIYFVYRGEKREIKMSDRIEKLEDRHNTVLVELNRESLELNRECVSAIRDNSAALDRNTAVMRQALDAHSS